MSLTTLKDDLRDLCVLLKVYNDQNLNARAEGLFNSHKVVLKMANETDIRLLYEVARCAVGLPNSSGSAVFLFFFSVNSDPSFPL